MKYLIGGILTAYLITSLFFGYIGGQDTGLWNADSNSYFHAFAWPYYFLKLIVYRLIHGRG